ncbi:hypothetical protein [Pseudomonas rhizophila]
MGISRFLNDLKPSLILSAIVLAALVVWSQISSSLDKACLEDGGKMAVTGEATLFSDEKAPVEGCIKSDSKSKN